MILISKSVRLLLNVFVMIGKLYNWPLSQATKTKLISQIIWIQIYSLHISSMYIFYLVKQVEYNTKTCNPLKSSVGEEIDLAVNLYWNALSCCQSGYGSDRTVFEVWSRFYQSKLINISLYLWRCCIYMSGSVNRHFND